MSKCKQVLINNGFNSYSLIRDADSPPPCCRFEEVEGGRGIETSAMIQLENA